MMLGGQFTAATMTSGAAEDTGRDLRCYSGGRAKARLPLSLKLVLVVPFVRRELSLFFGELRLTFERSLLILLTPVVMGQLVEKVASGIYRFVASDLFFLPAVLWMLVGPAVTYGAEYVLHYSGPVVLEFLITYASTRILLPGHGQTLLFINMLCMLIELAVMDAAFDTATGTYITRELSRLPAAARSGTILTCIGLDAFAPWAQSSTRYSLVSRAPSALCCLLPSIFDGEVFALWAARWACFSPCRQLRNNALS
jgi:hypothetical protein